METTNAPDQTAEMDRLVREAELEQELQRKALVAEKAQATLKGLDLTIRELKASGVGVQIVLNVSADEIMEKVEIGKSDWRRTLFVPNHWSMDVKNQYIEDAATGAARAFAAAMRELPTPEPKEPKPKKGDKDAPAQGA